MARDQQQMGLSRPCILLIVIAGMERFAFKGVASNLVTYLTDVVNMSNSSAAKTVSNWCGLTSIVPLLVAPLADFLWDRYSVILFSSFIYVVGLVAVTSTAFNGIWFPATSKIASTSFLLWSLCLISLGQGGYNPSLQAFAADQLGEDEEDQLPLKESNDHQGPTKRNRFFSWWYVGICGGSLLGVSIMAYIQEVLGWGIGFAIPTMVMVISILLLSSASPFYAYKQTRHSKVKPLENIIHAAKSGMSKLIANFGVKHSTTVEENKAELELQQESLCKLSIVDIKDSSERSNPRFQKARVVLRLLPIWTTLLIFAVIFQQPVTFFTKQGMTMKRNLGPKIKIPPATLQSAITISILLLMPMYDKMFIPLMRMITHNNKGISVTQRIGIGMLLSTAAMIIAALVEAKRLGTSKSLRLEADEVPMSIFWLLPQYILLGVSDVFTVVGMQEFFYREVPLEMKTIGIALNTSVYGVGSFVSAVLISLVEVFTGSSAGKVKGGWFSDDMREARIDKYYWLLAILSGFSMAIYTFLCGFFKSIEVESAESSE